MNDATDGEFTLHDLARFLVRYNGRLSVETEGKCLGLGEKMFVLRFRYRSEELVVSDPPAEDNDVAIARMVRRAEAVVREREKNDPHMIEFNRRCEVMRAELLRQMISGEKP